MMPPPEEVTPELKKAISESIDKRTINIDNVTPEAQALYIHHAGIDIDVAATYPDENTQKDMQKQISEDIQLGRGMTSPEGWVPDQPKRIAIIGGPRSIANHIIRVCEESGIEVTETSDRSRDQRYDEAKLIGNPNMKTISPAMLLNKHHHGASPYAHGKKPTIEDLSETLRKDMRKAQNVTNKANGFGKRLTKKDKLEMAKHKDGWHDPELTPHITIIDGKEVLSFRRKKNIQTYVSKFEHEVAIKVPTKELGFTTTAVDMEWKTTATVKDGKVTDVKVTDTKHTIDGESKDID